MSARNEIDPRLDHLYNKTVRCPYCGGKILKYTTTCERCGVHKKQILEASNKSAKEIQKQKTGEKIFKTRHKPDDISFTRLALLLIPGLFGTHNFYTGRRVRGFLMLGFMLIGITFFFIFPISGAEDGGIYVHPVRQVFEDIGLLFPTDFLVVAAFIMWAYDAFGIVFGFYKYPVRLADHPDKKTVEPKKQDSEPKVDNPTPKTPNYFIKSKK